MPIAVFSRLQGAVGVLWVSKTLLGGPILYISAVLPLWSAFAEKVRILTFCPKLVRKGLHLVNKQFEEEK